MRVIVFEPAPARPFAPLLRWIFVAILAVVSGAIGSLMLFPSGVAYALVGDALIVDAHAGLWDQGRVIPRGQIITAERGRLTGCRRTAGTAMPGYCSGQWTCAGVGPVRMATSCGADVVRVDVRGADRPLVLSPADPDAFVAAWRDGADGAFAVADSGGVPGWWGPFRVGVALLPVATGLLLAVLPLRLWYRVGGGTLELPRLGGARRYRIPGAVARACVPSGVWRVAGSAIPGHYSGWFRMDGRTVRVWASRMDVGVYVEHPSGWRIFLTPADRDAFLAAIAANGGHVVG